MLNQARPIIDNSKLRRAHIFELIDKHSDVMDKEIKKLSNRLQKEIDVLKLSNKIKAFLKMWERRYPLNAAQKLNEAIIPIVKDEVKLKVIDQLEWLYYELIEEKEDRMLDESDLLDTIDHVVIDDVDFYWVMQEQLEKEALCIMTKDKDTLLLTDYLPSSSYDPETKTFSYDENYIQECEENDIHIMTPKELPFYFKHPDDEWCCAICFYNNTIKPTTCVVTMCTHVFHKSCLLDWKKRGNKSKGCNECITCPYCRTDVFL